MWKSPLWKNNQVSAEKMVQKSTMLEYLCGFGTVAYRVPSDICRQMWQESTAEFHRKFTFTYLRSGESYYNNEGGPVMPYGKVRFLYKLGLTEVRASRKARANFVMYSILCVPSMPHSEDCAIPSFDIPLRRMPKATPADYHAFMDECVQSLYRSIEWILQCFLDRDDSDEYEHDEDGDDSDE